MRSKHQLQHLQERAHKLKKKRHRKRNRKDGKNIASASPQEDEGLEKLAVEEIGSDCKQGGCMKDAERIGKVQVKNFSGKEGYLSDFLVAFLSLQSNLSNAVLFGMVSMLMELLDSPIAQLIPATENLDTLKADLPPSSLLSLVVGGMLHKDTSSVRDFFSRLRACSKGLHPEDEDRSRGQDIINNGLDLCCSLIPFFAGQTLHRYGMKCFKLQNYYPPKNLEGKSKQKYLDCERFKEHYQETEINKPVCVQIKDYSKIHVESKWLIPVHHKRHKKIYKLAQTFQHPRIFSAIKMCTWKKSCGVGASSLYTETDAVSAKQKSLEDNYIRKLDDLTRRDTSCRPKYASVCKVGISEDDHLSTWRPLDRDYEDSVVARLDSGFFPVAHPCAGLRLPEEFAKQLVERYGCPGVELDEFESKDFIVPLGYDLAHRIYLKWKTSLEAKYKFIPAK